MFDSYPGTSLPHPWGWCTVPIVYFCCIYLRIWLSYFGLSLPIRFPVLRSLHNWFHLIQSNTWELLETSVFTPWCFEDKLMLFLSGFQSLCDRESSTHWFTPPNRCSNIQTGSVHLRAADSSASQIMVFVYFSLSKAQLWDSYLKGSKFAVWPARPAPSFLLLGIEIPSEWKQHFGSQHCGSLTLYFYYVPISCTDPSMPYRQHPSNTTSMN